MATVEVILHLVHHRTMALLVLLPIKIANQVRVLGQATQVIEVVLGQAMGVEVMVVEEAVEVAVMGAAEAVAVEVMVGVEAVVGAVEEVVGVIGNTNLFQL